MAIERPLLVCRWPRLDCEAVDSSTVRHSVRRRSRARERSSASRSVHAAGIQRTDELRCTARVDVQAHIQPFRYEKRLRFRTGLADIAAECVAYANVAAFTCIRAGEDELARSWADAVPLRKA